MNGAIKRIWNKWEEITSVWFSFIGWIVIWSVLYFITIYELYYSKNKSSGFIYLKLVFMIATIISSILLIVYIFKKSYFVSRKFLPSDKSKLLWFFTILEAIALCLILVSFAILIALTIRTIPGI